MKECKIIHINDGNSETIRNEGFLFVEEMSYTEKIIGEYLNAGYEVKHIVPEISPAKQSEGLFTFYKDGITVYLEREYVDDGSDERIKAAINEFNTDGIREDFYECEDTSVTEEFDFSEPEFDDIDFDDPE